MTKSTISRALCSVAVLVMGSALHADTFLYSSAASNGDAVNAVITAAPTSTAGQEDITAITGSVTYSGNTYNITGLIADATYTPITTPDGSFIIDNILYTSSPTAFDYYGVGFTDSNGNTGNIFNNPPEVFYVGMGPGNYPVTDTLTSESLTATPEPATLMLMPGAGALLLVASKLRKRAVR